MEILKDNHLRQRPLRKRHTRRENPLSAWYLILANVSLKHKLTAQSMGTGKGREKSGSLRRIVLRLLSPVVWVYGLPPAKIP
jgi:hypothetical protein